MEISKVDKEYVKEIEEARRKLRALVYEKKTLAPLMLRLAWNDAGTYDPQSSIRGGPNGSIRFEQDRQENKRLDEALKYCGDIKNKLRKKVSYADIYQLAGVVAVEITGGPTIDFVPGRVDSEEATHGGRLPDHKLKSASHLRDILTTRMGLTDQDIVALSGGHTLVEAYEDHDKGEAYEDHNHSGSTLSKGKRTPDPFKFDNSYFVELLKRDESLFRLPTDIALVEDRKFRKYVEKYAKDEDAFFKDYAAAHKKLSELGCNLKVAHQMPKFNKSKGVIGIVIVSAAILSKIYLWKRKNNLLKR